MTGIRCDQHRRYQRLLCQSVSRSVPVQLTLCRDTLQKAVRERWPSDSYDEKFRRTVVCSCLKQALVQVGACVNLQTSAVIALWCLNT